MKAPVIEIRLKSGRVRVTRCVGKRRTVVVDDKNEPIAVKPLLKWAGGKRWLAPVSRYLIPPKFSGRYYEPFIGGGSLYFALAPSSATLSDKNEELINTYLAISTDHEHVIERLKSYPHQKRFYYKLRASTPRSQCGRAARFLYLNRTCWNGLYRVNRAGQFNVPFGHFENPCICDQARIENAAMTLRSATLRHGDFALTLRSARKGDFAYLDPPYITGHNENGFHKYNAQLFSWDDQARLAKHAERLRQRGVHVLVTNADHKDVINLYPTFYCYRLRRNSLIAADRNHRTRVTECIFSSYPLFERRRT